MAFAQEVRDFVSAFGAMNEALGTKSSREAERARTDYTRALTDKTRWDMGESDRDAAGILGYADDRYGAIDGSDLNLGGSGGNNFLAGGINSGPIVIDGVTITGDFKGVDPSMYSVIRGMARGAKQAGLDRLDLTGGYEGGHKSHLSRHDLDFKGYQGNTLWNPEQRVAVARGGAAGGARRFGLYSFGEGFLGNGSLHIGKAGARNPRTGNPTPAAVWGYRGLTGGDASRAFTDPYERAFLRKFNTSDFGGSSGSDAQLGGEAEDVLADAPGIPPVYPHRGIIGSPDGRAAAEIIQRGTGGSFDNYRNAVASIESRGEEDPYRAVNRNSGALGRYQVMPQYLDDWSKEAFGRTVTPEEFLASPDMQDALFDVKFGQALRRTGSARDAFSIWFTGRPEAEGADATDGGITGREYVDRAMEALGQGGTLAHGRMHGFNPLAGGSANTGLPPSHRGIDTDVLFDELTATQEAGGDTRGVPDAFEARTKDDELDLAVIQAKPDSKIPWYNRGVFGSDLSEQLSKLQEIQEAIATSPIAPASGPGARSGFSTVVNGAGPPKDDILVGGVEPATLARARMKDDAIVDPAALLPPEPGPIAGGAVPGSASPSTVSGLFQPPVPDPNLRPETAAVPGTEAVAGVPTPPARPTAAIPEDAATGFDPLPQTSGHFDPVSQAGHETLTNTIRGTGNRHRQPFKGLLGRIFSAGRNMLGVPDEAVEVNDDDPRKDAFLGGVGGLNAELIDQVEDRIRAGQPNLSEEQVRMEVLSTLWNYFNENGQPDKADKVAFAVMQGYKQISQRFLALAQASLEEGKMDEAVDNFRAAYGMIPDGDAVDIQQMPDGNYQVTVVDANTGKQVKTIIKTPDQIMADIMDTTPEIFDNLIKKKIMGADSEPSAAETAAAEEAAWLKAGGLPGGGDAAIPEPPARPGLVGSDAGDDLLEDEAVPTETASVTPDVTLDGSDDGTSDVAIPTDKPTTPMTADEFNNYITTIAPGAIPMATAMWNRQQKAFAAWEKTQPTEAEILANNATVQFFNDLANARDENGNPVRFDPNDNVLAVVDEDTGNLMLRASEAHNKTVTDLATEQEKAVQRDVTGAVMETVAETPNAPSNVLSRFLTEAIALNAQNPPQYTPGSVDWREMTRPVQGIQPQPKAVPDYQEGAIPFMTSEQATKYNERFKTVSEANEGWNTQFGPRALDPELLKKWDDGTGAPLTERFVGALPGTETEAGDVNMLDAYVAYGKDPVRSSEKSQKYMQEFETFLIENPDLRGSIGAGATGVLMSPQTPGSQVVDPRTAFEATMNMLAVDPERPEAVTYVGVAMPDNPGMVTVVFGTEPQTEVVMPAQTYENLDAWRAKFQATYMNSAYMDEQTKTEDIRGNAAAEAAVAADLKRQTDAEKVALPPAQGGGIIPTAPSMMELEMGIEEAR